MSISLSPNLPANVVEIGNEISQAKINEINAGTLALQSWVSASYLTTASASSTYQTISGMSSYLTTASASSTYAPKANPTFTGTVTIPAGASISGYLTTSSASSTYQTISGMTSYLTTSAASSTYQPIGSYLTDAPSDGSEYVRKNAAWAVATGGGGGGISDAPSDGNLYARQNAAWTSFTIPTLSVTNIDLTGNFNGYSMGSGYYTFKFDSSANTLRMQDGVGSGITISATAITFPDSTTLSTAPVASGMSVNTQTSSYSLALTDANNIIYVPAGSSPTITIPYNSSVAFAVGTEITIVYDGSSSGSVYFQPQDTMTPLPVLVNFSTMTTSGIKKIVKVGTDLWISQ